MVIDSSALIAVLVGEEGAESFLDALAAGEKKYMSALNHFEAGIVMASRKGEAGSKALAALVANAQIEILPFDASQSEIALDAWRRYCKGRHPAALNLGDCAAYALAITLGQKFLFKGEDFPKTDVACF
jgi:ribonuclease VapC